MGSEMCIRDSLCAIHDCSLGISPATSYSGVKNLCWRMSFTRVSVGVPPSHCQEITNSSSYDPYSRNRWWQSDSTTSVRVALQSSCNMPQLVPKEAVALVQRTGPTLNWHITHRLGAGSGCAVDRPDKLTDAQATYRTTWLRSF